MNVRAVGLAALFAVCVSCGGAQRPAGGAPGQAARLDDDGSCRPPAEIKHPSFSSDRLALELPDRSPLGGLGGIVLPPFQFEASTAEDLHSAVEMELTIHDPRGRTIAKRFRYINMREECDPYCDPVGPVDTCGPRRCWTARFRPAPVRIDPAVYARATPGTWTYVLHRLDDGERVSVSRRLFEGEELTDPEACESLPVELGGFRRVSCKRGVVPLGTSTSHWGLKAVYERGGCPVNAFSLPLDDSIRTAFDEGPYNRGRARAFPEGTVREVEVEEVTARAWLAHHHVYVFAAAQELGAFDGVVRAMLDVFPVVDGPVRTIPACEATGAVTTLTVPPITMDALRDQSGFVTHFEGNRPSGVRMWFHDAHPLARAGLRRQEILHAVDGRRVSSRREIEAVLERLTRPGHLELVVARSRMRDLRCIRLTLASSPEPSEASQSHPTPPPRPEGPPRGGRHCERRTDRCWDCVDIAFPAELGCHADCRRGELCVGQGGSARCLAPARVCCLAGEPCERPEGCEGPAISCSSDLPSGRTERCTFLSECEAPLPAR